MKKIEFTEDQRKALAGLLPFAPGASVPFTPEAFQSVEEALRPVFSVVAYKEKERKYMRDKLASGTLDKSAVADAMWGSGLRWKNLIDIDGNEIEATEENKGALLLLPDNAFFQIDERMTAITVGPTKEEKQALM